MLSIKNLNVMVENKLILKDFNLSVAAGEVHAIMGPNGSGKSTLAHVLAGKEGYEVISGEINYCGENLLALSTEQRAQKGVFLAMQYPVELPGVNNMMFIRESLNAISRARGEEEYDAVRFMKLIREKAAAVELDNKLLKRNVNSGFSGGEKKRNEILQMAILQPQLCILDETDSGLDIDALRVVAKGVNDLRNKDRAMIVVTHYQRLLNYIEPDYVHVMIDGRIAASGDKNLALELEEKGYNWLIEETAA
ncbi:MAG: Fe-S cluster assembly ATPase SufC [Gammaproteobacteria bacterium]|nr:Fe-S cluster assembly ATPase SufC [Gammaproteobacteria bacterium]MCW8988216.1 Fe-S cluster assembly ATPase SufC [Gammaproteobacteria bacterium]MCW9030455.1 Fe-S cluster assembly ATPase SufC [Gammaproteobacteria bacterium]